LDISLQPADRVYYQPAQWRRWGASLFLPWDTELAPRIDTDDAIPLLARILEQADQTPGDGPDSAAVAECVATLWDSGRDGEIVETRVANTVPLLTQYHLLNSFQRNQATDVEQATRQRLAEAVRAARGRVDAQLDGLSKDLLDHAAGRTAKLEAIYSRLEANLTAAEKLADAAEPRVAKVTQFIDNLPRTWLAFVNRVLELHRELMDPQLAAFSEFSGRLTLGRDRLRALAARGRDLAQTAQRQHARFQQSLAECETIIQESDRQIAGIDELSTRTSHVLTQVAEVHGQMDARLERIRQAEEKAQKMQEEIDRIQAREREIKKRLEELRPLYEEHQKKAAELETMRKENDAKERTLQEKCAEIAWQRENVKQRCLQVAAQLEQIETRLAAFAQQTSELDQVSGALQQHVEMIDSHAAVIALWEKKREAWEKYVTDARQNATQQIAQLYQAVDRLLQADETSGKVRACVEAARAELGRAEKALA
jgi:DNA repair exonuclease SbcCD ATPase subunit